MIAYFYVSCVTRMNLDTHIYICILSGRKKCDKYAIIICNLCYKDKLGQTYICILSGRKNVINMLSYLHVSCVTRINLDKHYIYICRAMTQLPRSSSTAECLRLIACLREEQASTASWEPRPPFEAAEMD